MVHKGAGVQSLTNVGQKIEVYRFGLFLRDHIGLHMEIKIIDAPMVSFVPFLPCRMMGIGLGPVKHSCVLSDSTPLSTLR